MGRCWQSWWAVVRRPIDGRDLCMDGTTIGLQSRGCPPLHLMIGGTHSCMTKGQKFYICSDGTHTHTLPKQSDCLEEAGRSKEMNKT